MGVKRFTEGHRRKTFSVAMNIIPFRCFAKSQRYLFTANGFVKKIMCRIANERNIRNVINTFLYTQI